VAAVFFKKSWVTHSKKMTRLLSDDIAGISAGLNEYDTELLAKTGHSLRGLACYAVGLREEEISVAMPKVRIGVVPIAWGKGVIGGFSKTTHDILQHLGFQTFITSDPNVSGLAQALAQGADIIFLSDDDDFVALNVECRQVVENGQATGKGFAAGLNLMTGGLQGQKTLVMGCGPVGGSAAMALAKYGARVSVYDIDSSRSHQLASEMGARLNMKINARLDLKKALSQHSIIVEATNSANTILAEDLAVAVYIAAPGMPLGLAPEARKKVSERLLHDPLQIGVAIMGMAALKQILNHV
jgi:pyrrolysine biosynthesis protein PylD